jgi:heme exporter protein B
MMNALLMYMVGAVFIIYYSNFGRGTQVTPSMWLSLFWVVILFSSVNAAARSFMLEGQKRHIYYYFMVRPTALIASKILYNMVLLSVMAMVGFLLFYLLMGEAVQDIPMFLLVLLIGVWNLAAALTLISGIAAQTQHSMTLMAVLSFPMVIPLLLLLIKASKVAMDGLDRSLLTDDLIILLSIKVILVSISFLLFPYLWRN